MSEITNNYGIVLPLARNDSKRLNDIQLIKAAIANIDTIMKSISDVSTGVSGSNAATINANFNGAVTPFVGVRRYYPRTNIIISDIALSLNVASLSNLTIAIRVNDVVKETVVLPASNLHTKKSTLINVLLSDYLTIDVVSGNAADLSIRLGY